MENKPRKWWTAGLLSLIEPGLGQIYNGQALKGIFFLITPIVLCPLMILSVNMDNILFLLILFLISIVFYYIIVISDAIYSGLKFKTDYTLKKYNKIIVYIGVIIFVFIINTIITGFIKNNYIQAYKIPAGSNKPTLQIGDHILVNRCVSARNPNSGDLIIFEFPEDPSKDFVKRVIAVGGDILEIKDKVLLINNNVKKENYVIYCDSIIFAANHSPRDNFGPITVPEDAFFVMGDNRDNSYDSRFWGFVNKSKIKGTVKNIYWSWDKKNFNARWDRIGLKVE